MVSLLPVATFGRIRYTVQSPQARAFDWVLSDPNFDLYQQEGGWKLIQRFALACFYMATNGRDSWVENSNWLEYGKPEATWYRKEFTEYVWFPAFPSLVDYLFDPADPTAKPLQQLGPVSWKQQIDWINPH